MPLSFPDITPAEAFARMRQQRRSMRDYLTLRRTQMQSDCDADLVLSIAPHCKAQIDIWDAAAAVPGLVQYVKDQMDDQGFDVVAEFQAMRSSYLSLRDGIIAAFPKDVDGWLLYHKLNADGSLQVRQVPAAQLASVVTLVEAALATL